MKIIHTADIHLGATPDIGYPWSKKRSEDIVTTFRELIARCKDERADLLLIAGDLFHRQPQKRELKELNTLFAGIPDTAVALIAGNHDAIGANSFYTDFPFAKNVITLFGRKSERVDIPKLDLSLYGCSYYGRQIRENVYDTLRPSSDMRYHILLAHGGDEAHIPIDFKRLAGAGFDYVALGHIHKPQILIPDRMAYAGSPEPLDAAESGPHGYMEVTLDATGSRLLFVPCAKAAYRQMDIPVRPDLTQTGLEQVLAQGIGHAGRDDIYRVNLTGIRDPEIEFSGQRLQTLGNIISVTDDTRPDYDLEALKVRYKGTLVGAYIEKLENGTKREKKALYYGLWAMLES